MSPVRKSKPSRVDPHRIVPLFNPLRIEYSWEGAFEYDRLNKGHSWRVAEKRLWRRTRLKVTRDGKTEKFKEYDLRKSAREYNDAICEELLRIANSVSKSVSKYPVDATQWQLLQWLRTPLVPPQYEIVSGGLSLVLNTLIRQSTTKPFDIISSFTRENVSFELRELGNLIPCWFYIQLSSPFCDLDESLVCFPELFLRPGGVKDDVETLFRSLLHVRYKHHYEVLRVEQDEKRIRVTLRDEVVIAEYVKASVCGCIPVPGQPRKERRKEPQGVNSPEVVVTTPIVRHALKELSRVWQDPHTKSVLISSPPGSGKEVFANSIPVGNGRPSDKLFSISMASDDHRGIERRLYGFGRPDGSVQDGLIAKASGGALFLDEIHQPENDKASAARASLLRTLEAEKYSPLESPQQLNVENVLWIFATSKTLEQLAEFKPVDFWTRMTHAMQMPHPLNLDSPQIEIIPDGPKQKILTNIVGDFFRCFWWDLCDRQYQIDPSENPNDLRANVIPTYWRQQSMLRVIVDDTGNPIDDENDGRFASCFLKNLRKHRMQPHEFSVRGIRNMVTRLFAIAWSNVEQGREPWDTDLEFEEDMNKIFKEIQGVARLS